jgi:hypothetical protein
MFSLRHSGARALASEPGIQKLLIEIPGSRYRRERKAFAA